MGGGTVNYGFTTILKLRELTAQLENCFLQQEQISFEQIVSVLFPEALDKLNEDLYEQYLIGYKQGRISNIIQEHFEEIGWPKQYEDKRNN